MSNDAEYMQAITQAEANLVDVRERGDEALGESWEELQKELFTPEEIAASELRVKMMIEISRARRERGITQKELGELSGVKQPIIARMEKGSTKPQLDTILKVLAPLGKTLYIGDLPTAEI